MPRGVPVATVAINNATNAALLAVRMLGISDTDLVSRFSFLSFLLLHMSQIEEELGNLNINEIGGF
jgi:phosphoribosylcarboxyaminoimidazole (NCAIR) mutase